MAKLAIWKETYAVLPHGIYKHNELHIIIFDRLHSLAVAAV